ncbi:MAG: glycosyltransferase family 4 protein [Clostridia bacterium]|nr:glycosyltransferase family 4 protein [Clostridia bacterium]
MNICFFTGNMGNSGGTEKMTQLLSSELCKNKDHNIYILTKSNKNIKPYFTLDEDVKYSILDNGKYIKIFSLIKDVFLLKKYIKKNKIDVLINVDVSLGVFTLPLKILYPKLKQIYWEHFCVLYNINNKRTNNLRKKALKCGDAYVVLTPQDANELKCTYKKINAKLLNIPNISTYQKSDMTYKLDSKTIVSVGNLIKVKGFDLAVDAAVKVFAKHPDWCWHIYGAGSDFDEFKQMVKDLSLDNNIKFMGRTNDLTKAYSEASLYVLPSRSEGFGLVLIEAQAHHLPTIAFDVPFGPRNVITDGVNGFLIEPFDTNQMADSICRLIEDNNLRRTFSDNATKDVNKYQADVVAEEWVKLLQDI